MMPLILGKGMKRLEVGGLGRRVTELDKSLCLPSYL